MLLTRDGYNNEAQKRVYGMRVEEGMGHVYDHDWQIIVDQYTNLICIISSSEQCIDSHRLPLVYVYLLKIFGIE